MPTAGKLVAAVFFAILGFLMAEAYKHVMPPETQFGKFSLITAAIGLLCGWLIVGSLTGRGYGRAWGLGIRTAITIVAWATLGFSLYEMILRSMKGRYGGSPMEALTGAVKLILEYGQKMADQQFLLTLFIGGIIGGLATEWASRRWR
jgi:hypothetical protein